MAKPTTGDRLAAAKAELEATNKQTAETAARRKARLLAGDTAAAIAKLDGELELLRQAAGTENDRIRLLEVEAAKEGREALAKKRAGLIDKFAKTLAESDALADLMQSDLAKVEQTFRRIIKLREQALAMWPSGDSHSAAVARTPEGAAMSAGAIATLVKYELFRIGARPYAGGEMGARVEVEFPGGASPRLDWLMLPERVVPLATALKAASEFAVATMRDRLDPLKALPLPPMAHVAGTSNEQKLSRLLQEQSRLAADISPEGEAKYHAIVAEIAALGAVNDGAPANG